ncbi:MAG: hypothetical protein K9L98_02675 [Candidatus Pacebacteria bacterium]|nr:hypothetical protein [Candidatus Paceibacterota bacterium]MCF7862889.1 hypothetical protein [Candidatus Paceibacterota bacterium]
MELRATLFWDTDISKIDFKKNKKYVIERILDFGNQEEIQWMHKEYSQDDVKDTLINSRVLGSRSKNFWEHYYNIN